MVSRAFLPLLLIILALSCATVTLLARGTLTLPSEETVARACSDAATKPADCPEPETPSAPPLLTIPPHIDRPGFSYPSSWSAVNTYTLLEEGTRTILFVDTGLITLCENCDGPNTAVRIITEPLTPEMQTDTAASIARLYTDMNVTLSSTTKENGTLFTITGADSGMISGPFTELIFVGKTSFARALFHEKTDFTHNDSLFRDMIAALDFSLIP